jgi:broad specificity phosphatase PhoE
LTIFRRARPDHGDDRSETWPRLVMLRHGVTTYPPGTYLGSRTDPPLSPRGERQALEARGTLDRLDLSVVVVSPLRRAMETASLAVPPAVAQARRMVDDRLREQDLGDYSGLTWEEIKRLDREAARAWRGGAAAPGGESAGQMWQRTIEAALEIATGLPSGTNALFVSHSGPIRALLASARGLAPADVRRIQVPHGRLRSVRLTPWVLRRWQEIVARA